MLANEMSGYGSSLAAAVREKGLKADIDGVKSYLRGRIDSVERKLMHALRNQEALAELRPQIEGYLGMIK